MASIDYNLNSVQFEEMEEYILRLPGIAEGVINETLHGEGTKAMVQAMIKFTPKSKLQKTHAKDSNPYITWASNLRVILSEKEKFSYLVFPELAIGRRFVNYEDDGFMARGVQSVQEEVFDMILKALTNKLNN